MKKPAASKRPAAAVLKRPSAKTKRTRLGINVEGQGCGSTFRELSYHFWVIYIISISQPFACSILASNTCFWHLMMKVLVLPKADKTLMMPMPNLET